jgi:hypothetical protein
MFSQDDLDKLSLYELQERCEKETAHYFRHLVDDSRYCFELFRRAVVEHNQEAWEAIVRQYEDQIRRWVQGQAVFLTVWEEEAYFVNRAFEKFWKRRFSKAEFERFPNLQSVLKYLKLCAVTVVIDFKRTRAGNEPGFSEDLLQLEQYQGSVGVAEKVFDKLRAEELWKLIQSRLEGEAEYHVLYDSIVLGLKPAEILERRPRVFDNINEVYRVKGRVIDRLRHDVELLTYFKNKAGEIG